MKINKLRLLRIMYVESIKKSCGNMLEVGFMCFLLFIIFHFLIFFNNVKVSDFIFINLSILIVYNFFWLLSSIEPMMIRNDIMKELRK